MVHLWGMLFGSSAASDRHPWRYVTSVSCLAPGSLQALDTHSLSLFSRDLRHWQCSMYIEVLWALIQYCKYTIFSMKGVVYLNSLFSASSTSPIANAHVRVGWVTCEQCCKSVPKQLMAGPWCAGKDQTSSCSRYYDSVCVDTQHQIVSLEWMPHRVHCPNNSVLLTSSYYQVRLFGERPSSAALWPSLSPHCLVSLLQRITLTDEVFTKHHRMQRKKWEEALTL